MSPWTVHAGCVFVIRIHVFRTWMSGCFESLQWSACVHRLDLGLYSHLKEFSGNGVRTHVNSKRKIPSTGSSEEGQTRDATSHRTGSPTHYWLSCSGPIQGSISHIPWWIHTTWPVTWTLILLWIPCQAHGIIGLALGLVSLVSVDRDWVR